MLSSWSYINLFLCLYLQLINWFHWRISLLLYKQPLFEVMERYKEKVYKAPPLQNYFTSPQKDTNQVTVWRETFVWKNLDFLVISAKEWRKRDKNKIKKCGSSHLWNDFNLIKNAHLFVQCYNYLIKFIFFFDARNSRTIH